MIPQIFVKDGAPIKMRIHSSIANLNSREVIATQILVSAYAFGSTPSYVSNAD